MTGLGSLKKEKSEYSVRFFRKGGGAMNADYSIGTGSWIYGVPSVSKILPNGILVYLLRIYKYDSYLSKCLPY